MHDSVIKEDGRVEMVPGYAVSDKQRYSRGIFNRTYDKINPARIDFPGKVPTTINGGAISWKSGFMSLTAESGSTDDLTTIYGGKVGDRIVLTSSTSGQTITIKDATDNLYLASDFAMDSDMDKIELIKEENNEWHELNRSNNA